MSAGILQGHGRVLLRHARRLQELLEVLSGEPRVLSLPGGEAFASSPRQHHQSRLLFQARPVRCWSPFNPLTALIHTQQQQQPPFYGRYFQVSLRLLAPPVTNWWILLVQSFTACLILRVRIREKMLEFSSTVLSVLYLYLALIYNSIILDDTKLTLFLGG